MKELPRRKRLRLPEHDYLRNCSYFITICCEKRQQLFGDILSDPLCGVGADPCVRPSAAGEMIEKWLFKIPDKFPEYILDQFVIMPDHMHFIIIKCDMAGGHMGPPLQSVIRWFKTQTTNDYIRGVDSEIYPPFYGKIWQRGYYEHIIRNMHEMEDIRRYIYENPMRWHIENDECYPWD